MRIDLNDIKIPTEKLDAVVSESMDTIRISHKRKQFHKIAGRCAAIVVCIVMLSVVLISNPALAEKLPLIGNIFGRVQDEQIYSGDYASIADSLDETQSAKSDGITVTLSEISCTDTALNAAVIIESEEAFSEEFQKNSQGTNENGYANRLTMEFEQTMDFAGIKDETSGHITGHMEDDHTFVGAFRIDFSLYPYGELEIPDSFTWDLKIHSIRCLDETGVVFLAEGDNWEFSNVVEKTEIDIRTVEVNQAAPNGMVITDITISPYEAIINIAYDETLIQPGYEDVSSLQSVMLDGSGKKITDKVGMFPTQDYDLSNITVYYMSTPTDEAWMAIQDRVNLGDTEETLREYLEGIAVYKIEIPLE